MISPGRLYLAAAVVAAWLLVQKPAGAARGVLRLDPSRLGSVPGLDSRRIYVAQVLVDEFARIGALSAYEIAGMLAIAYREGRFDMRARSAGSAPDAGAGHSWGTFQFTASTLRGLGVSLEQITPVQLADGSISAGEIERAARGSARAALAFLSQRPGWAGGRTFLEAVRTRHGGDQRAVFRDILVAWSGGVGRTFADIANVPSNPRPGSLGFIHVAIASKFSALPYFTYALGLIDARA